MENFYIIFTAAKDIPEGGGDDDGTMASSGAADADDKLALAFRLEPREEKIHEPGEFG